MLREPSAGYSANCNEAMFGIQKASFKLFREYSPSSANTASDWLRAKRALLWMRKKEKYKWMTLSIRHSLRRELTCLSPCERRSLVSGTQNDIVGSWITMWVMIKVYCLAFSLHFGSCCLLHFCRKFGPKLASHYKPVKKRSTVRRTVQTMFGELKVRLSSIKKWISVRRTTRSMFGELTVRSVKNGLNRGNLRQLCAPHLRRNLAICRTGNMSHLTW